MEQTGWKLRTEMEPQQRLLICGLGGLGPRHSFELQDFRYHLTLARREKSIKERLHCDWWRRRLEEESSVFWLAIFSLVPMDDAARTSSDCLFGRSTHSRYSNLLELTGVEDFYHIIIIFIHHQNQSSNQQFMVGSWNSPQQILFEKAVSQAVSQAKM